MARPATIFRNEFKTRVEDWIAAVIQAQVVETGMSEARVIRDLLAFACRGMFGTLPDDEPNFRHQLAISGPQIQTPKRVLQSCL